MDTGDSSRPGSPGGRRREKKRVEFSSDDASGTAVPDSFSQPPFGRVRGDSLSSNVMRGLGRSTIHSRSGSATGVPPLSAQETQQIHDALRLPARPRPALRNVPGPQPSLDDIELDGHNEDGLRSFRRARAREAYERGKQLETSERTQSELNSRNTSPDRSHSIAPEDEKAADSDSDEGLEMARQRRTRTEAHRLIRQHLSTPDGAWSPTRIFGPSTPTEELHGFDDQYPSPAEYRGGVLGWILRLYHSRSRQNSIFSGSSGLTTPADSPPASGASTPTWFSSANKSWSSSSLAGLLGNAASFGEKSSPRFKHHGEKKGRQRSYSATALATMQRVLRVKNARQIEQNIAETISCQKFLVRLCRALMLFGAPTHRLEENMQTCARMLSIQAQFLYIPGSMIVAFDDLKTHTSDVRLVRVEQGLDLGKLRDVHEIYKQVIHKHISVDPAIARLEDVVNRESKHSRWFRIVVFGLAAMSVGPFAFGARIIDLPVAFVLGCILGFLQLVMSPQSKLYANVFEIAATVITSFLSRAFGSIRDVNGKYMFCFAALSQSSIALILPGYIVLCASLELQSRSMIAGSIRMVYAIIYSLFLGFGITIGSTLYGIMDTNATSATTCESPMKEPYFFAFVPLFTLCLIIINQAKWKQAPIMLIIAIAGYLANYYSSKKFTGNTQISNTIGALVIGLMANLYSRVGASMENRLINLWERISPLSYTLKRMEEGRPRVSNRRVGYGLAAAAMLPAIWVQVPSGIAVNGSLISSIASADQITGTAQNGTTVANNSTMMAAASPLNTIAFTVGYSVIQVAIGITVGLFLSAIAVYPLGKRQSGLFSL